MSLFTLIGGGLVGIAVLTLLGAFVCSAIIGDIGVLVGGLGAPAAVGCALGGPVGGVVAGVVALVVLAITMVKGGHEASTEDAVYEGADGASYEGPQPLPKAIVLDRER